MPSSAADTVLILLTPEGELRGGERDLHRRREGPQRKPAEVEVPGRAPTRAVSATVTTTPGENGTWDTGETVTAQVVFNRAVTVYGPTSSTPTLGILLGGTRREAELTTTESSATLVFSHTVTADDDGATSATVVADGIKLNGRIIGDTDGNVAILTFDGSIEPSLLSVADATAAEGADASAEFMVTLMPASSAPVTVRYDTADGTATEGDDYTATSGTLTFAAYETSRIVSVPDHRRFGCRQRRDVHPHAQQRGGAPHSPMRWRRG